MAHYALLDENNIVTEVITGKDEDDLDTLPEGFSSWEDYYGNFRNMTCKRTSYNTIANAHTLDGVAFRGNFAGIGYNYDETNDIFLPPKPFDSWVLDLDIANYVAPVPYPEDGLGYEWNEVTMSWDLIEDV